MTFPKNYPNKDEWINKTHYYYIFTALYQTELLPSLRQEAGLEPATSGLQGYVIINWFAVWVFKNGLLR